MRILYFAWLRHRVGRPSEELDALPEGVATAHELARWLAARSDGFREAWEAPGVVRIAVNHEHVTEDVPIKATDEIAFFPPVTGG